MSRKRKLLTQITHDKEKSGGASALQGNYQMKKSIPTKIMILNASNKQKNFPPPRN